MRCSPLPLLVRSASQPSRGDREPGGNPAPRSAGVGCGRAASRLAQRLRAACEAEPELHAGSQKERTTPWVRVKLDAQVLVLWLGLEFMGPGAGSCSVGLAKHGTWGTLH